MRYIPRMDFQPTNLQSDIARRLAEIVHVLGSIVRRWPAWPPIVNPLLGLAFARLRRAVFRLDRLVVRWRTGNLRPKSARPRTSPRPKPPRPELRAPARNAWLLHILQPMAHGQSYLRDLLADPEIQALIEAAPQAGRLFRPLCRMFGLPVPENLRLPPRPPRAPKPAPAPAPEPPARDHYAFSQVPKKWQFKVPHLRRRKNRLA